MNILITIPSLSGKGGVANYYNSILPFLADKKDYKISYLEIGSAKSSCGFLHSLVDQTRIYKSLSNNKVDLVHINPSLDPKSFLRDGITIYLTKRKRLPVLVFFHGWTRSFERSIEKYWMWFFKKTYAKADCFLVLASDFKNKLREWGIKTPIYEETTIIDENLIKNFDIDLMLKKRKKKTRIDILFLAAIKEDKGIFETIDICALLKKRGLSIYLTVSGQGPELLNAQDYALKRLGENVRFTGYVKNQDKIEVFEQSDFYLLPTTHGEGIPISILEAMAFGLPVITRPVGGLKDFFENGKMGYLTESRNPKIFASLIENLFKNRKLVNYISLSNHEYAKENFISSKVAPRIKKYYRVIIDNSK